MNALANAEVIRAGNIERNGMCKTTSLIDDPQTPGSDCNSNPASDPQDLISSEFIQDNMDYQWFIDYRDGGLHVHPSILSSLSASYTKDDLGYYDDLARNLDANLAEVDMESFRTADIRSLLTALPVMCTDPVQHSEGEDSACSTTDTISICKSSLLFSPVKETPVLPSGGSYSVDSLDCEDMLITCQTNNKNNYTIAFEGSMTMYSDSSQDFGNTEKQKGNNVQESLNTKNLNLKNMLDLSMARSDSKIYTTWSNLKHVSIDNKKITRHPSGNNNTIPNFMHSTENPNFNTNKNKSQSLPDLIKSQEVERMEIPLNFSVDSGESSSRSGRLHSSGFSMSRSINEENSDSVGNTLSGKKLQNMSLVKLFMKQKSMSTEGMSLTLDQADSESETGWPTSNSDSGTHTNTQIHHPNFINSTQSNDLAIKWVKTDNNIKNVPKLSIHSTSLEDISNSSKSVSTETQSKLHKPEIKTTGIQVKTEVEDNSVQTSLIYSLSNDKESKSEKPVYVIYPNYVLPDLSFLNSMDNKFDNIALKPQVFDKRYSRSSRPFSCNDVDSLKQRGFSHVKDWESLTFLLPVEYKKILQTVPEASEHIQLGEETRKPLFCLTPPMQHRKRTINDVLPTNISSSSSSNSTHPSSGYRGSSTILSDSSSNQQNSSNNILQGNPLYLYRYDSMSSETSLMGQDKINSSRQTQKTNGSNLLKRSNVMQNDCGAPPRPPLPRSILRKNRVSSNKRCSMFEMGQVKEINNKHLQENKRMSLQEPYYMNNDLHLMRNGGIIDSEKDIDEVEEKLQRSKTGKLKSMENEDLDSSGEDIRQLEEFLRRSGFSSHSSDSEGSELENNMKLQSCVKRFLALKMNHDITRMMDLADSQKKTVSFAVSGKLNYQKDKLTTPNTNEQIDNNFELKYLDLEEKKKIVQSVNKATNIIMKFWHGERPTYNQKPNNEMNECSQLCLSNLCPALYAVMSDGLKPNLNSAFGPISNSVWHVVEASSQQGPLTKTLNDLVQKINADDFMTEGMLKFNAFIFGLLNLKALDAWFAYLCTRESILRKHYYTNSIFVEALSCESTREVVNAFLKILHPLVFCPFQLDLLYQYRQLHNSFGQGSTLNLETNGKKPRPRSCILFDSSNNDKIIEESETNKRWSHIPLSGNFHIFDRLNDSEDYTDSLEHSPMISKASPKRSVTGKHQKSKKEDEILNTDFRKLKEKWEHFGRDDNVTNEQIPLTLPLSPTRTQVNTSKSKIPRPLTSPIRVPLNISTPQGKPAKSPSSIPSLKNKIIKKSNTFCKDSPRRTSRLDQENSSVPRNHLTRPSSLPYKTFSANTKDRNITSPHRRAASTSIPRPSSAGAPRNIPTKNAPKVVKTLTSKPESENGHLSFGEGEKLKVILEVDSKWLLCSKGERKGLVPRNCIRIVQT